MQVVALATEAPLAAALNMMDGWEISFASEVEQASQLAIGAAVVLVGGGTSEGLRIIEELRGKGVTIPAVVMGDEPAPEGARYPVVVPPFTLEELRALVEIVVRDAATKAVLRPASGAPRVDTAEAHAPAVDPYATPEPTESERHLRLAPRPESVDVEPEEPEPALVEPEEPAPAAPAAQDPPPPPAAPAPPPKPAAQAPPSTPAASTLPRPGRSVPAGGTPIPPVPPGAVIVGPARGQAVRRGLLRRRTKDEAVEPTAESTLAVKLHAAAYALERIEAAIEELPVLTDLRALTQALINEVVELLSPQVAGLYLPSPEGYRTWASYGFSSVERTMTVTPHQPLFSDLFEGHEAVLIEPLDLATSLVSGIGGARTNAFLASPIEANGKKVGVIVAGREHFENEDLERLESLTEEAAMGLAIALSLDQLRTLL